MPRPMPRQGSGSSQQRTGEADKSIGFPPQDISNKQQREIAEGTIDMGKLRST